MPTLAIRNVLAPTDLSEASERSLEHAAFLARSFGACLTLYHAADMPDHAQPHWAFAHGHELWHQAEETARHHLQVRAAELDIEHEIVVERAVSPRRALLGHIRATAPDLTVMATHARKRLERLLLGSVSEAVFRHAYRPVLCVREPEQASAHEYQRILLPTDLSVGASLAFPMAATLAKRFGASVLAVHVAAKAETVPTQSKIAKELEPIFDKVELRVEIFEGRPWHRIVEIARVEKADLVIMASRGRDSLGDEIFGSTTERVVRHASCPVLVA